MKFTVVYEFPVSKIVYYISYVWCQWEAFTYVYVWFVKRITLCEDKWYNALTKYRNLHQKCMTVNQVQSIISYELSPYAVDACNFPNCVCNVIKSCLLRINFHILLEFSFLWDFVIFEKHYVMKRVAMEAIFSCIVGKRAC